jgi:hypothetical protein
MIHPASFVIFTLSILHGVWMFFPSLLGISVALGRAFFF